MTKTIKFNSADDFHKKIGDLREVTKGDKYLKTDLSIKAKDGRFYKLIKILLSIFPGDRFEKTRIYNVAASIEKLCSDHQTWVSQQDKDNLTSVFDFLQTLSSKSKSQKRKDLNEKAIKNARESIAKLGPTTLKTSTSKKKTPSTPSPVLELGEMEKMLKEMPSFYKDSVTSEEVAKQNREKGKNLLGSYLLNLKQEEALGINQKYKIGDLLHGDNGLWLKDNFSKLSPAAIAQITNACKVGIGQKVWSTSLVPLLVKMGTASQLKAFARTHTLYQGENNLSWNKNAEGLDLAHYSAWVIKNWETSSTQEILDKLSLEDQKGWVKSLVGYVAGYAQSPDSLFLFVDSLPAELRATAIEELNQTTSPNVLRELLTRGWGNDLTLDYLFSSGPEGSFGWYKVTSTEKDLDLTPLYERVYNLLVESPGNRSEGIKKFFNTIHDNKEALEAIGLQIKPEHLAKLNAASPFYNLEPILQMSIEVIKSAPSKRRDESLEVIAKLAIPKLHQNYTIKSEFQKWEQPLIKLFEAGVSDFQVGLVQELPYDLALPFLKKLSPEQLTLIGKSKDKYSLKHNGFPPSIAVELSTAQLAGLINGICEGTPSTPETDKKGHKKVKKEVVTSYLTDLLKSPQKEQLALLVNQINYDNLKYIDLLSKKIPPSDPIIFSDLIPFLGDMTQPNQRFLIGSGIANLSKYYTVDKRLHAALELLTEEQMLNLSFEKLPTPLNILILSKANAPLEMWKQLLPQIDKMSKTDVLKFGCLLSDYLPNTTSLIKVLAEPTIDLATASLRKNVMQGIVDSWSSKYGFADPLPEEVILQIKTMSPEQFTDTMTMFGSEKNRWSLLENHSLDALHDSACKLWVNQFNLNFYSTHRFPRFLNYLEEKKVVEVLKVILGATYQPQVPTGGNAYSGLRQTLGYLEKSPKQLQNFKKDEIDWKGVMQYSFNTYPELMTTYPKCYAIIQENAK